MEIRADGAVRQLRPLHRGRPCARPRRARR
jgi:hypothetical protein